ncbi:hypothetical protein BV25DRAFT_1831841 [Artomyces pyxidatus]|uniref:Uncharacterized protein n=1 Tax=Artomyces pyxidatus TaxID=48021 RepID=A0ACB8SM22_9AGAM|nr:hypothetical protein BV25DRAFT_1831841 [Artomyces pyxidatus]
MCMARLGLKAPARARLGGVTACQILEPGRCSRLRLGQGLARLRPGLCINTARVEDISEISLKTVPHYQSQAFSGTCTFSCLVTIGLHVSRQLETTSGH